jgi:hypothetical protein
MMTMALMMMMMMMEGRGGEWEEVEKGEYIFFRHNILHECL